MKVEACGNILFYLFCCEQKQECRLC